MAWVVYSIGFLFLMLTGILLWQQWDQYAEAKKATASFQVFRAALVAMEKVSMERGPSNSVLGEELPIPPGRLEALRKARETSNTALQALYARVEAESGDCAWCDEELEAVEGARADLMAARERVDELIGLPLTQRNSPDLTDTVNRMVSVVPQFTQLIYESNMDIIRSDLNAVDPLQMAWLAALLREHAGLLGSRFTSALSRSRALTMPEQLAIEHSHGRIEQLHALIDLGATHNPFLSRHNLPRMNEEYFGKGMAYVAQVRELVAAGSTALPSTAEFADRYVPMMRSIVDFRDEMLQLAESEVRRHEHAALQQFFRTAAAGLILVFLLMALWTVFRWQVMMPFTEAANAIIAIAADRFPEKIQSRRYHGQAQSLFEAVAVLKENSLARTRLERERHELIAELKAMAETDALTHLLNRRAFESQAHALFSAAPEGEAFLALILFDIDHFKKINDTYGHPTGDAALKAVAELCREIWRKQDVVARVGGEEFAVLMGTGHPADAVEAAQRFRQRLARIVLHDERGTSFTITASFGIAFSKRPASPELSTLLKRADQQLYQAKGNGRNRVESERFPDT